MSILVVGSVALDTVETPFGRVTNALGGSATYFSVAASLFAPVSVVAVVGTDFPAEHLDFLGSRGIDLSGLQVQSGESFRWSGRYGFDLNQAETLDTQLNVFAAFHPHLPSAFADAEFVFLANIDPELQLEVLEQIPNAKLRALDTMNFWIESKRAALARTMSKVDVITMNEAEVRQFAGTSSLIAAARTILSLGPKALVVKKGEYGCTVFGPEGFFFTPAYPLEEVRDPTGAGDSFAGGFIGYLAKSKTITDGTIRRAVVHGSVVASFTVEDFSINRLRQVSPAEVARRYDEFRNFVHFDGP